MEFTISEDRNKFIEENMPLVTARVIKLNKGIFDEDLFQEGSLALTLAAERFDASKGFAFSTFAVKYIDGWILRYKNLNATIRPLRRGGAFLYHSVDSLQRTIGDEEDRMSLGDILSSDIEVEKEAVGNIVAKTFMNTLKDRERQILILSMNGIAQKNIGKIVGASQPQVSRILKHIGKKYQSKMEERKWVSV